MIWENSYGHRMPKGADTQCPCASDADQLQCPRHFRFGPKNVALGQKQTFRPEISMSALPPKPDIVGVSSDAAMRPPHRRIF